MQRDLTTAYLRWTTSRSAIARGYWLVTAVYLVVVADLSPVQLVLIGTFQGLTVVATEVPAGVLADTVSRRLSLVIGHVVMGTGMAMAGIVTAFPALVMSQCLWGLGWAFSSGADVAWVTDELRRPDLINRVLAAQARWDVLGAPIGMVSFGVLAWATSLSVAIVTSGTAMALLGLAVVARWPEAGFVPVAAGSRWRDAASILRGGVRLARADHAILAALAATLLLRGGIEAYGRLVERRLIALGVPADPDPVLWFAALGLVGFALGASVLRIVEARVDGGGAAPRAYAAACAAGAVGLVVFAHAPNLASAVAGVLVVSGIADPVTRLATTIWVNDRTTSSVRATVHSFVSQAEHGGEILLGLVLAVVAGTASTSVALTASAALFVSSALVAVRAVDDPVDATAGRLHRERG